MSPSLEGPRLKLRRAREHLYTLHDLTEPFAKTERKRVTPEFNPKTGCKDFWLDPTPAPPEWGPILGDVLYNCRSALDHLANQLAGGRLNDYETFWPIFMNPADFGPKVAPFISRMPRGAETLLQESQPYSRKLPPAKPANDSLAVLNRLSNADKHRHLHVGVVGISSVGLWGEWELKSFYGGVVEQRTQLAAVAVPGPEVDVPLSFTMHVAFAHYRRWQMPIQVVRFFEEAIRDIDTIFARCVKMELLPP